MIPENQMPVVTDSRISLLAPTSVTYRTAGGVEMSLAPGQLQRADRSVFSTKFEISYGRLQTARIEARVRHGFRVGEE